MGASIEHDSSNLVTVRFSGRVKASEWRAAQNRLMELFEKTKKQIVLLVIAEHFTGWDSGGNWDNTPFQSESKTILHRMAIVADPKWKESILFFAGKGLRGFEIEHFPPSDVGLAQAWLESKG